MKPETIALHAGYESRSRRPRRWRCRSTRRWRTPSTVPRTAPRSSILKSRDIATRASAILPCTVLERRVAELEGGIDALAVGLRADGAVLHGAQSARAAGRTSSPCRSSTARRTRCSRTCCRRSAMQVRFGKSDRAAELEELIDENTRALFCETVGNPAGNICDLEALARSRTARTHPADRRQHRADAGAHPPDRVRRRHHRALAHEVHGRPRHDARRRGRRQRQFHVGGAWRALPDVHRAGSVLSRPRLHRSTTVRRPSSGACAASSSAPWARCSHPSTRSCCCRASRPWRCGSSGTWRTRGAWPSSCAPTPRVASVSYAGFPDNPYYELNRKYLGGRTCSLLTFAIRGGYDAGTRFYDALKLFKRLVNLGDAKSLACHPASTTHRQMSPEEQRIAGIGPETHPPLASASSTSTTSSPISTRRSVPPSVRSEAAVSAHCRALSASSRSSSASTEATERKFSGVMSGLRDGEVELRLHREHEVHHLDRAHAELAQAPLHRQGRGGVGFAQDLRDLAQQAVTQCLAHCANDTVSGERIAARRRDDERQPVAIDGGGRRPPGALQVCGDLCKGETLQQLRIARGEGALRGTGRAAPWRRRTGSPRGSVG